MATDTVNADTRYSFPLQFLRSSAVFARQSAEIEKSGLNFESIADDDRTKYLGFVTAAVMQCVAAVESESAELTLHGPGAHLGSGPGWNLQDRDLLKPHAEEIDHQEALDRFNSILNILCKPQLDAGAPPWQDMAVLGSRLIKSTKR